MANQYMDMETLRFLLFDLHESQQLLEHQRFAHFDRESVDLFLDSVKAFSDQDAFPVFREMDEDPARYENGRIYTHPAVGMVMRSGGEMGVIGASFDESVGGMNLPAVFNQAAYFIMDAANNHLTGYLALTSGSARLIASFGDEHLKDTYLPPMLSGEWGGTMCLTEPQAGSSLSDITTAAVPQPDGTYRIKGQKIFISGGDHPYADNFVHLLLARIEGAPAGTKGISLFVVPANRINQDGSLEPNDVTVAGDFQKMGQKSYCTTHLVFGDHDDCQAWLVGEPNKGLNYMFQMMNEARLGVGSGAVSVSTAAYYASLQYANERPQGRRLSKDGSKDLSQDQTLIKNHPDVRRMLLLQKSITEGALSLLVQATLYHDLATMPDSEDAPRYHALLEMLTPVVKAYATEKGKEAVDNGLQVLGGYGYCSDFVLQQYYRDIRIMAIYEGTTGIQSLDLLGRKVTWNNGEGLKLLSEEIMSSITEASSLEALRSYASQLAGQLKAVQEVLEYLMPFALQGNHERFLADATIFMEFFGNIIIGWQWLKIGIVAQRALLTGDSRHSPDFYESKLLTMRFFFKYELTQNLSLAAILRHPEIHTIVEEQDLLST